MKSKPRSTLNLRAILALALSSFLLQPTSVFSQQRTRAKSPKPPATQSKTADRARRALAAALLVETADKARSLDNLFYRARIQMLAADALWTQDATQARAIFRRAWEAATVSDKADREEEARETGALPGAVQRVTEARDEVLAKAAARDARLAEIFLRDLSGEKDEGTASRNEAAARRTAWRELSASGARRLALASELLELGETSRAAEIAAPIINEGVSAGLMAFILRLRLKSATDGAALYLRLLERAAADPQTDANALLLLSSPIVSPHLMVVVDEFGSLQFRIVAQPKATDIQRASFGTKADTIFYNLAASVLSRPLPPRDALTMQELVARFYATGRLLPYFENSSASYAAHAPILRARQSELFNELEAGRRDQVSSQFALNSLTPAGYVDPLRSQADELAQATDPQERSSIALSIVKAAVRNKFWDRARRAAAELEDEGRRKVALSFIQVHQIKDILHAYEDQKEDDYESVAKFVRGADVPQFAKAWGLAQAATIAARKRDAARTSQTVSELINEAESHAERAAQGTPERVAAYGVITIAASRLDGARAWGLLRELVKAANAVEDFTGDEVSIDLYSDAAATNEADDFYVEAEVFRLGEIFATMAHLDFDKALAEARALNGDVPQALATIAVAKSRIQETEGKKVMGDR